MPAIKGFKTNSPLGYAWLDDSVYVPSLLPEHILFTLCSIKELDSLPMIGYPISCSFNRVHNAKH